LPAGVDFAFVLLGSLTLPNAEAIVSHFDSVAACLRPGGLYLLDWCIQFGWPEEEMETWEMVEGEVTVRVTVGARILSRADQLVRDRIGLEVQDGRRQLLLQDERERVLIFPQEFLRFIEARPDFEFVGWWNDWDLEVPLGGLAHVNRPIVVIRRV
jgi:hypothetical protein